MEIRFGDLLILLQLAIILIALGQIKEIEREQMQVMCANSDVQVEVCEDY